MEAFSSLPSNEQALLMLMAYFYENDKPKHVFADMSSKIMSVHLFEHTFQKLKSKGWLVENHSLFYPDQMLYGVKANVVIAAISELFKAKNSPLLTVIRELFKKDTRSLPAPFVCLIASFVAEKAPEAKRKVYDDTRKLFYENCYSVLYDRAFERVFRSMSDDAIAIILSQNFVSGLLRNEKMDWDYLKGMVFDRRKGNPDIIGNQDLESVFAFYYYLGTGEVCISLRSYVANPFTLQIAAIEAAYKGNYTLAYTLYTKAMTANNKVASEKGIFLNPVSNFYFTLIAIFVNTEASLKKIRTLLNKTRHPSYWRSRMLVAPLKDYFCDGRETVLSDREYEETCKQGNMQLIAWLSWPLYNRLGLLSEKAVMPSGAPAWAFMQHEVGLKDDSSLAAELQKRFGGTSLLSRLEIKSLWQMRLESIISENLSDSEDEAGTTLNTRLVYLLRFGNIVPILKRKLKNGNWSVGKELSVRELSSLDDPCLDGSDQRIKENIYSWDYSIYIDKYLHLLVDCDHVYTGSTYNLQPVKVHKDSPHLVIDKRNDGSFAVSTNVTELIIGEKSSFFYEKNSETDYSIFTPSDFEYKVYKKILAQKVYPAEAEPLLLQLMKAIGGKTEIHSNMVAGFDDFERIEVPSCITLRVTSDGHDCFLLTASVRASESQQFVPGKGTVATVAEQEGKKVQLVRNLKKERECLKTLNEGLSLSEVFDDEAWSPQSINETVRLPLHSMLPFLQWCKEHRDACILEWSEDCKIKYYPEISSSAARFSFRSKNGWFEVEGDVEISEGQVVSLQKLLEMMRQSSRQKYIRIGDNEFMTLSSQLSRLLKRLDTVTTENRSHLQMAPAAVSLIGDLLDDDTLNIKHNETMDALRQRIEACSKKVPVVPKTLQAQLRDYQEEGFEWMSRLTAWGAGVCLADDMGLGKTVQTIALLLEQSENGASLIVAPASVVPNWRNELHRFAPTLNLTVLNQSEDRSKDIKEAKAGDVIIITYAMLNIQREELTAREWNVVCLDEAHSIKNSNTKMSKSAMLLKVQRKVILTGTPIQNHLAELWNLFQFINPGLLGSAEQFRKKFIQPIEAEHDKNRQNQLRRLISPFLLRRTKAEVIDELPAKNEIKLPVELSSEEMTMYEVHRRETEARVRDNKADKVSTLAEITRLRQMACSCSLVDKKWKLPSSKTLAFIDLAEGLNDSGNRALVFSQFTSFFEEVKKAMDKAGLPYLYLDGSTPMAVREKLVRDFQIGKCPFFLISLKAGGLGLNLTGANYVVHLDPWWNPAIEQQATDRAYRIGQQQDVTVYRLISQHTIEEKILRLHKTKRNLSDSLLEGSDVSHAMTQEELLELLQDNG